MAPLSGASTIYRRCIALPTLRGPYDLPACGKDCVGGGLQGSVWGFFTKGSRHLLLCTEQCVFVDN